MQLLHVFGDFVVEAGNNGVTRGEGVELLEGFFDLPFFQELVGLFHLSPAFVGHGCQGLLGLALWRFLGCARATRM